MLVSHLDGAGLDVTKVPWRALLPDKVCPLKWHGLVRCSTQLEARSVDEVGEVPCQGLTEAEFNALLSVLRENPGLEQIA